MLREPSVAGAFYPAGRAELEATLDRLVVGPGQTVAAVGAVSPHAGYMYSGRAAGGLFAAIEVPPTVVILGPNHRGVGARYGVYDEGAWRTPMGDTAVDEELAAAILKEAEFLQADTASHLYEHSIEVQVPFLMYRRADVAIVPVSIGEHDFERLERLGSAIAAACASLDREVLVLASSDMTHYESAESAERKDRMAIERMQALDEEGLWQVVRSHRISMCGVAPAVAAIVAARRMGARDGRLISYMTSAEATGDDREVVGYASLAFGKESQ